MKRRRVLFAPEASEDLASLYTFIADASGADRALSFISRLEAFCLGFEIAAERGTVRNDLRDGLRITSFQRRVTLAFTADAEKVIFLRLFYAGADWERAFPEE
jgi:toxin ParE1/3/4